ncbi:hypothetical protein WJX82_008908 [Trebouxia sp. C0006]
MLQFRSAHFRPALSTAQLRSHSSVYTEPVTRGCRTGGATRAQAGKGFGKSQEAQDVVEKPDSNLKKKKSAKKTSRRSSGPQTNKLEKQFRSAAEDLQQGVQEFDETFEARLKGLKQQAAQRTLESPNAQPAEEANRNIYAEPPPLSQTLFGNKDKDKAKKDEPSTFFNQAALTVGSLLLIVVFVVVSGGSDLANIASPRQSAPQSRELSADQKAQLKQQAQQFETQLASNAQDVEALEGAGVSYAQLGDFKRAEALLSKLTSAKPKDPEAWRLLAETRLQLLDYKRTAAAYEQAMAAAPSIDLLQNLAAAYVNDGKPQSAIDAVKAAGQHLPSSQEELATMGYSETEISLLLGRVYAQWPGHDGQALDIYDKLIQKNPDDFRGYLARGVLFRGEGRQGDAERMFLQARYIAPKESRALVDRVIGPS